LGRLIHSFEASILDLGRHGHDGAGLLHRFIRMDREQAVFELRFQLVDDGGGDEAGRSIQSLFNGDELAVFVFLGNLIGYTTFAEKTANNIDEFAVGRIVGLELKRLSTIRARCLRPWADNTDSWRCRW
jgi:hypothetical protein